MAGTLKCPGCGSKTTAARGGYLACAQCGQLWAPCRRCRYYQPVGPECASPELPEPRRITDPDQTMSCCRLPPPVVRKWPVAATLAAAALVALGLWLALLLYQQAEQDSRPTLFLRIPLTHTAQLGQPYQLAARIFNPSRVEAEQVSLAVDNQYLEHFQLELVDPPPQEVINRRRTRVFVFGNLAAGRDLEVIFELRPIAAGRWPGRAVLGSRGQVNHRTVRFITQVAP